MAPLLQRPAFYQLANAAAPVLGIACILSFAAAAYPLAWACALGVALSMETRVQAGGRIPHTALFWAHLFAATPALLALTALAFFVRSGWLEAAAACFGALTLASGAVLWQRGVERVLHL